MDRLFTNHFARICGVGLLMLTACRGAENRGAVAQSPDCNAQAMASTARAEETHPGPVRLLACPVQGDLRGGDHVEILVLLQNVSGSTITLPDRFLLGAELDAAIRRPSGEPLRTATILDPAPVGTAQKVLRPGEFIEQVVNLSCLLNDDTDTRTGDCRMPLYTFDEEGVYRIVMRYTPGCSDPQCPPGLSPQSQVEADPLKVQVRSG